jgi:C_GCAxxG_C_C family probable redox protein
LSITITHLIIGFSDINYRILTIDAESPIDYNFIAILDQYRSYKEKYMTQNDIEQKAFQYYHSGFNCAEAILKAFVDLYGKKPDLEITKTATGFGGGIGASQCETCGALTGGIIAIGWLFGRRDPCDDKQKAFSLSSEFRARFMKKFGATQCKTILDVLGDQENKLKCKKLTAAAAGMLYEILQAEQVPCK